MTQTTVLVNPASDNWDAVYNKVNELANLMSNTVMTANTNANGSVTTGNAYGVGIFTYQTVTAYAGLRGGNVQTSEVLTITSNVNITDTILWIGNTTVNTFANLTHIHTGSSTDNATITSTDFFYGDGTSAFSANHTHLTIGPVAASANQFVANTIYMGVGNTVLNGMIGPSFVKIGNTVANLVMNWNLIEAGNTTTNVSISVGASTTTTYSNSTVVHAYVPPTVAQAATNTTFWAADGSWIDLATGAETITSGATPHEIDNWLLSDYYSCEYSITVNDENANNRFANKFLVLQDEGDAYYTEYAIVESNSAMGTATANANATHVRVWFDPVSTSTTVKVRGELTRK